MANLRLWTHQNHFLWYSATMMLRRITTLLFPVTLLSLVVLLPGLILAEANPAIGTWKLDPAKSKYSTESLPKSGTLTIEAQGDALKANCELVEADGTNVAYSYTANYDSKDYPISGSGGSSWREGLMSGAETIALRRENPRTFGAALKKSGSVVMTMKTVVSKDGKIMTITANGADAKGQPTTFLSVWDKQ
jgi:hypothetical protein